MPLFLSTLLEKMTINNNGVLFLEENSRHGRLINGEGNLLSVLKHLISSLAMEFSKL